MNLETWITLAAIALAAPAATLAQSHAHAPGQGTAAKAKAVRTIAIDVTSEGFTPSDVKVKAGEPLELVVTRKTQKTCATEIVIRDYGIQRELPLDRPVTIELTPKKSGQIRYGCAMNMIAGTLTVD